ncbi:MAG: hypothetical protein HPY53_16265 [Brevinematales bacterium]|nr:hypothetical protein [Brevinematales bacterium]
MFRKLFVIMAVLFSFGFAYTQSIAPSKWKAEYYNNPYLAGTPFLSQNEAAPIKYKWWASPVPGMYRDLISIRWIGQFNTPSDEVYVMKFSSDDGIRIYIDGKPVVNRWYEQKAADMEKPIYLKKGKHEVKIEFFDVLGAAAVSFDIVRQFGDSDDTVAITGKAVLPNGAKAPQDKEIYFTASGSGGQNYYGYTVIPSGKNAAAYQVGIPAGKMNMTLRYDTAPDICTGLGYYSPSGTAALLKDAGSIAVNGSPVTGIDIPLAAGPALSGIISIPGGSTAPSEGIPVYVTVMRDNSDEYVLPLTIPAGKNSAPYSVMVPKSADTSLYQVGFALIYEGYMDWGYYNPERTFSMKGEAKWQRITDTGVKNLDMELVKAGIVSGTISLENGAKAEKEIWVTIQGISVDNPDQMYTRYLNYALIPQGENSGPFTIKLPIDPVENTYYIRYICTLHGIQRTGYYSKGGTLKFADAKKAVKFDLYQGNYSGINLIIKKDPKQLSLDEEKEIGKQKAQSIVKEIVKPGMTDYEKLLVLHDYLCQNSVYGWNEVSSSVYTILCNGVGECSSHAAAMYEMLTAAGVECKIVGGVGHVWDIVKIDGKWYYHDATYDDNGKDYHEYSCFLLSEAQLINMGHSWKIQDFPPSPDPFVFKKDYLPDKKLVQNDQFYRVMGNISLPDGEVAGENGVEIRFWGDYFFIPPGKNSTPYIVPYFKIDQNDERVLGMSIKSGQGYISWGYAGKNGYTPYKDQAIKFKKDYSEDIIGLNLTLQKGVTVSGTISLPDGMTAPKEGVTVWMNVFDADKHVLGWPGFTIPYGESSVGYSMGVAPGNYYFGAQDTSMPALFPNSYYSKNGPVYVIRDAEPVKVGSKPLDGIGIVLAQGAAVEGKISLPAGAKAPQGGFPLYVKFYDSADISVYSRKVVITEGSNSLVFKLTAPPFDFKIGYDWAGGEYCPWGYFSKKGTVYDIRDALLFKGKPAALKGIDMALEKGDVISGKVMLPAGTAAPANGVTVWVSIYNEAKERLKSPSFVIPAGQSSVEYRIVMPKQSPPPKYYISYNWVKGFVSAGYYSKGKTVFKIEDAALLDMSKGDFKNIDLTLVRGFEVSGSFILPKGITAPEGGLTVYFARYEEDKNHQNWWPHTIPAGENKLDFIYNFLPGKYYFAYNWADGYVNPGFYSKQGFVNKIDAAGLVDLTKQDVSGINLYLTPGMELSGTLSLPDGEKAPQGGIKAWVNIYGTNRKAVVWPGFTIPEGQNSTPFKIYLTEGIYYIGYNEVVPANFVNKQLYSKNGMTPYFEQAYIIDLTKKGVSGVDLQVFQGLKVSGTVYLPQGETAPAGGVSVWVNLWDANKKAMIWPKVTIHEGKNSADFDIYYRKGEYYIGFNGVSATQYKDWRIYTKQGMVDSFAKASTFKLTQDTGGFKLYIEKK